MTPETTKTVTVRLTVGIPTTSSRHDIREEVVGRLMRAAQLDNSVLRRYRESLTTDIIPGASTNFTVQWHDVEVELALSVEDLLRFVETYNKVIEGGQV